MARQTPETSGGKLLASDIKGFIQANIEEMKKSKDDAATNEKVGIEDISNAIAFGIEKVMKNLFTITPTPQKAPVVSSLGAPVGGVLDLSTGAPYTFK